MNVLKVFKTAQKVLEREEADEAFNFEQMSGLVTIW